MYICNKCNKELNSGDLFCKCGKGRTLYHDRYRILDVIGSGGMATLYLAEDLNLAGTHCVIKAMTDEFKTSEEKDYAVNKFKEEAVLLARLRHNSLPVVQNHFLEEGRYYLVMDYVEGETLEDILNSTLTEDCLLSEELVIDWVIQVCDILDYLHNYDPMIIHRDIKPANLMENKKGKIMLLDFGIAHIFEKRDTKTRIGSAGYAAPEQYAGNAYPQSDIFALGAVLHTLLTGENPMEREGNPFLFPPLGDSRDDLTEGLEEIVSKAVAQEVKDRYSSAAAFKEDLLKISDKREEIEKSQRLKDKTESHTSVFSELFKIEHTSELSDLKERLSNIVALDTGSWEIKILQLDLDSKKHIYPRLIGTKNVPENSISEGVITDIPSMSKAVKSLLKDMNEKEVIVSLSPYCVFIKTLLIRALDFPLTSPEKINFILNDEIRQILPLPLEDWFITYNIDSSYRENFMKVRVTAVKKKAYENIRETLLQSGCSNFKIIAEPLAESFLADFMIKDKKKNILIINTGFEGTSLTFVEDRKVSFSATYPFGGKTFTQALMVARQLNFNDAEDIKKKKHDEFISELLYPIFKEWTDELLKTLKKSDCSPDKFETIVFCGGTIQLEGFHDYINSELKIKSYKFSLPRLSKTTMRDSYKNLVTTKGTSFMPAMGLVISSLNNINDIREILDINKIDFSKEFYGFTPFEITDAYDGKKEKGEEVVAVSPDNKNITAELEKYLVSLVGPIGKSVMEDSIKKLGYTVETMPVEKLDGVIEMFACQFNLSQENMSGIIKKLEELKTVHEEVRKSITGMLDNRDDVDVMQEIEKYLVSMVGPIGKTVLEDSVKKLGYTVDTVPLEQLDGAIEMFCCQFNLTEENISSISKKLQELKTIDENARTLYISLYGEDINVVDELEKYLITIVGPIGKTVFEDSLKKLGHTRDTVPLQTLDSIIEIFSCQFNLTQENIVNITKKLQELKIAGKKLGKNSPQNKEDKKSGGKGILSSLFKWGK
ncbi:MAG: pilus assembly protein PilM [Candidatus Eremiobacterota bacterium]